MRNIDNGRFEFESFSGAVLKSSTGAFASLDLLHKYYFAEKMFSVFKTEQEVLKKLQDLIESIANESISNRGKFFIGFSGKTDNKCKSLHFDIELKYLTFTFYILGGSLGKYLCETLPNIKTEWSKWTVFFCDERVVDSSDNDSTFGY